MVKAVFTTKVTPSYDDLPEVRYHFPRTYLNQVQRTVGDHVVYYEPRRSSGETSSSGGRQSYFGVARVVEIISDPNLSDHYYALVDNYLDFDHPVPFQQSGLYYESALQKEDGSTNRGAFGRAVRNVSDQEYDLILRSGFRPVLVDSAALEHRLPSGFSEPDTAFERPIVEMTVLRPFRERSFMHNVRTAYSNRCAVTGLSLINGGGKPEVQAAHIQPVSLNGPDSIRNGLALSGTAHWMFDRGLISIDDDYKVLVARNHVPDNAARLLIQNERINLPNDPSLFPNTRFLRFHRDNIYKG